MLLATCSARDARLRQPDVLYCTHGSMASLKSRLLKLRFRNQPVKRRNIDEVSTDRLGRMGRSRTLSRSEALRFFPGRPGIRDDHFGYPGRLLERGALAAA